METILAVLICVLAIGVVVLVGIIGDLRTRVGELEDKLFMEGIKRESAFKVTKAQGELLSTICEAIAKSEKNVGKL
jgi:hypothetical protein